MEKFNEDKKKEILASFYGLKCKDEQDIFLQGLIMCTTVKRVKPVENKQPKSFTYTYFTLVDGNRHQICHKAFLSLYSVTAKRVYRICLLLSKNLTPRDSRGKQRSGNAIPADVTTLISEHINSFPKKVSHYSGSDMEYLDARLTVKKMYSLFKTKHPEVKISYTFYWKFFKENFTLRFGRPQVDTCSFCEEKGALLRSTINDNAKRVITAELLVHKRKAQKFYKKLKSVEKLCHEREDVAGICFDFMSNLPLPNIPVQDIFYYRQLWINTFEIHNLGKNNGMLFIYHEGQAKKSPNEICTFLEMYINSLDEKIQELHVFSDNCAGQNKNHTVTRYLLALVDTKRFSKIFQYFPVRGHSYLPCDRDFSQLKRQLKKHDRIYVPEEYILLLKRASEKNKFEIKEVSTDSVKNFKEWWPKFYKKQVVSVESSGSKVPRAQKQDFKISTFMQLTYDATSPGTVVANTFIDGLMSHTFQLKKTNNVEISPGKSYNNKIPINIKKMQDIRKVMQYIPEEFHYFYSEILDWPTTNAETDNLQDP